MNEGLEQLLQTADETLVEQELASDEQQHQELLLMDLLDGFSRQLLEPCYHREADLSVRIDSTAG